MVASIIPNLIAPDLVSTQAIDNRVGMVNILQFAYGSDKGQVKNGQVFASALGYTHMDSSYTSSSIDGEVLAAVDGEYRLAFTPVTEGSLRVVKADGSKVDAVLEDRLTGVISGVEDGDIAYYAYDNETVPVQSPQLKMDIKSLPIVAQSRKLSAIWAFDASYELSKEYGSSMQDLLTTQATAEIAAEIDNEITMDLYRAANAGPEIAWSRIQPTGVSVSEHYDSFYAKVIEGSNAIFGATQRARANFLVGGLGVDSVLKVMRNFEASEDTSAVGPHYTGTLGGTIKCYVNPNFGPNEFVLGYKGPSMIDAGYIYAPYMPVLTTGMVSLADFSMQQGWATMYGKKIVNPRLYIKGRIDG